MTRTVGIGLWPSRGHLWIHTATWWELVYGHRGATPGFKEPLGGLVYDNHGATSGFKEPLGGLIYDHRGATAGFMTIARPDRGDLSGQVGWVPQKNNDYI